MPKPLLRPEYDKLEWEMIETFLAGLHEWRPDLDYPQSHSDMQGGIRGILRMFEVKRRPLSLAPGDLVHDAERCGGPCCRKS